MKISARNRLRGKIVEVTKGKTTAHVRIDTGGAIVTAAISYSVDGKQQIAILAGDSLFTFGLP